MRAPRGLALFVVASATAVAAGSATLALAGSGPGTWARNPVAWLAGALLGAVLARLARSPAALFSVLALGSVAVAATLAAEPVDGVHRWLDLGPLHINAAALLLPAALVALARIGRPAVTIAYPALIGIILLLQPDASQATAFLGGAILLVLALPVRRAARVGGAALLLMIALGSWTRPDPLQPVAEVEEIFSLAFAVSPLAAGVAALALLGTCLSPLLQRDEDRRAGAAALAAYFLIAAAAPLAGAFPVPLVGLGMSFPVGMWLGACLLWARRGDAGPAR